MKIKQLNTSYDIWFVIFMSGINLDGRDIFNSIPNHVIHSEILSEYGKKLKGSFFPFLF